LLLKLIAVMDMEELIEQLYIKIKDREKIYALALKMRKDQHSLENMRMDIEHLKQELQQSLFRFKARN
jgi:hypothetical protein